MSSNGEISHISKLRQDARNARKHNPRNVGMIERALNEVGAARSIVIDEEGRILAGNATVEAAAQAGIERVQVVDADGETIIAVRRKGLSEEQKARLALYDNRAAELADWDVDELLESLKRDEDALDGLFDDWELRKLIHDFGTDVDIESEWQGMPEFEQEDNLGAFSSITVHFTDAAAIEEFSQKIGQTVTSRTKFIWYPKQERLNLKGFISHDES